jgi:O-acetylserine/cysteine efflux transporter
MPIRHLLLALVVITVWGFNFVVIKLGLSGMPPMLLGALRFILAAFPAVLLVRRPRIALRWLIAYGLSISFGQFAFLFMAIDHGMPPGLASLVLQSQALFTFVLAYAFLGEPLRIESMLGLMVAGLGLAVIGGQHGAVLPLAGVLMTLAAAAMWAVGNVITRRFQGVDQLALVSWAALVPPLPFLLASLWLDGPERMADALGQLKLTTLLCLLYLAYAATTLGYGLWSRLLSWYPAGKVAAFALLVPVIGLGSSALVLDERLPPAVWSGGALVMTGLLIHLFGGQVWRIRRSSNTSAL